MIVLLGLICMYKYGNVLTLVSRCFYLKPFEEIAPHNQCLCEGGYIQDIETLTKYVVL